MSLWNRINEACLRTKKKKNLACRHMCQDVTRDVDWMVEQVKQAGVFCASGDPLSVRGDRAYLFLSYITARQGVIYKDKMLKLSLYIAHCSLLLCSVTCFRLC